ncbi:hypothetical protein RhiirA4_474373 [Rhizophagus irregularis]|uniref:Uncharacterized protein n=1 Tax=Rhizophagus irregularis TaxID=588596 RepID=A0A2I1H8A9_9GLOM|nr:hypothetical protein RhiirA4_474373 [Rhizophagus irregularis]
MFNSFKSKNLAFSKININENLLENTNIDKYQNSNQQILVDQIINLTYGLSEILVILLIEIAQQLTNDQYSNKNIQLINKNNYWLNTGEIFSKYLQKKTKLKSLYGKVSKYNQLYRQIQLKAKNPSKLNVQNPTKSVIEWLIDKKPDKWFSAYIFVGWHKELYELQGAKQSVQRQITSGMVENPILKLQIESLVEFDEKIYEPIMDFLVKSEE